MIRALSLILALCGSVAVWCTLIGWAAQPQMIQMAAFAGAGLSFLLVWERGSR